MQKYKKMVKDDLVYIRGMFTDNMYIGGSFARNYTIPLRSVDECGDVDIFIVKDPFLETWVIEQFLSKRFKCNRSNIKEKYYLFKGQYLLFNLVSKCSNIKYDLIFMREPNTMMDVRTFLSSVVASDLSMFFIKIDYSDAMFNINSIKDNIDKYASIVASGVIRLDESLATSKHKESIFKYVKDYNSKYGDILSIEYVDGTTPNMIL